MMSKTESHTKATLLKIALIPVIAVLGFLFSTKTIAQNTIKDAKQQQTESSLNGASQEMMNEYKAIIEKNHKILRNRNQTYSDGFSKTDIKRLEEIYLQMNKEQQSAQMYAFVRTKQIVSNGLLLTIAAFPNQKQSKSFEDPCIYGVWVDGIRVSNGLQNNYRISTLNKKNFVKGTKSSKYSGKRVYQVSSMYDKY